eukprot:TRINITY_DN4478_c0_g1_i1.p1 TRINITY_DN4478_c0_g1~~TRINITY_DN4478_c0_g1_i1.p1  ORF type:complete len:149 (+),score=38.82 TRINITY_DN4478_c0_g1_i1:270-716(+)
MCCVSGLGVTEGTACCRFAGVVKLKSVTVIGGPDGRAPSRMRAFINTETLDFAGAEGQPAVQEWDLHEDPAGRLEYQTRFAKFQSVSTLVLFFPSNFGADTTQIFFIGLKGEHTQLRRDAVVANYELRPQAKDHRLRGVHEQGHTLGS